VATVLFVSLAGMSWNFYSASRLLVGNSLFVSPQRSYSGVAGAAATRFIGLLIVSIFTYRMWLWDGVPSYLTCCAPKKDGVVILKKKRVAPIPRRPYADGSSQTTRHSVISSTTPQDKTTTVEPSSSAIDFSPSKAKETTTEPHPYMIDSAPSTTMDCLISSSIDTLEVPGGVHAHSSSIDLSRPRLPSPTSEHHPEDISHNQETGSRMLDSDSRESSQERMAFTVEENR